MPIRRVLDRVRAVDWDPSHWARRALKTTGRALTRLWGRDVMLYVGGVSFFALLAIFPALTILIGVYGVLADPAQAGREAEALARMMPNSARALFERELLRLSHAPGGALSTQSAIALVIGAYAAHRGFKALLAGLSFIHDEENQRGFVSFNVLALVVAIAAFAMLGLLSAAFFYLRLMGATFDLKPLAGASWLYSEWTWSSIGLTLALSLIYRFAMSSRQVAWRASILGGIVAAWLCLFMSWASAFYVEQIVELGATYGSIATVVVFLIWLSWNVNAVFFGGALATEVEIVIDAQEAVLLPDLRGEKAKIVSRSGS